MSPTLLGDVPSATDLRNLLLPVGVILPYAGDPGSAPATFEFCRGQLVAKATYPGLDALIGDSFGVGSPGYHRYNGGTDPGSGNMRLPNFRRAMALGAGPGSGPAGSDAAGAQSGSNSHSHADGTLAMASHQHSPGTLLIASHGHGENFSMPDHIHSFSTGAKPVIGADAAAFLPHSSTTVGSGVIALGGAISAAGAMAATGLTAAASPDVSGATATAEAPYLVLNFLVKTG